MVNFSIFASWFLFFLGLGFIFLPFSLRIVKDSGIFTWIYAKITGLLLICYITWTLIHLDFVVFSNLTIGVVIVAAIFLNLYLLKQDSKNFVNYLKKYFAKVCLFEIFFALSSLVYLIYRGINPKVEGIEKYMDQAVLMDLVKSPHMPPIDIWYATSHFQYYYFGQFIYSCIVKLLNTPFDLSYNIAIAYSFGLSIVLIAGTLNLILKNKYFALLGTIITMLCGNLDYFYKVYFIKKQDYFFAEARSLIEFAITEFPAYSFILGDFHAHFLNIPFVCFYIGLSYLYFAKKQSSEFFIFTGFTLGIFFMINSWDYIIYGLLTSIIFLFKLTKSKNIKDEIKDYLIVVLSSILTLLPFKLNFNAAVTGIGFNNKFTSPQALGLMFLHFIIIFVVYKFVSKFLTKKHNSESFINLLFAFACLLVIISEFIFIKDIYYTANPPYFRANTVFKFWYQAFIIFGITSSYVIYRLISSRKTLAILISIFFLSIFTINFSYTYNGIKYYFNTSPKNERGLNGLTFLDSANLKDEKQAIYFMNKKINNQVIILEKPGESYTTDNLFSTFTGNPTIVGWINHEFGWQGTWDPIAKTLVDIEIIYTSPNKEQIDTLLKKYHISYVIIGNKERTKYGEQTGKTVESMGTVFYKNSTITIIKL